MTRVMRPAAALRVHEGAAGLPERIELFGVVSE